MTRIERIISKATQWLREENLFGDDLFTAEEVKNNNIEGALEDILDMECSNGHFSRWTSHGVAVYNTWMEIQAKVRAI